MYLAASASVLIEITGAPGEIAGRHRKPYLLTAQNLVILGVGADPKPEIGALIEQGECPVIVGDTNRPQVANRFEVQ